MLRLFYHFLDVDDKRRLNVLRNLDELACLVQREPLGSKAQIGPLPERVASLVEGIVRHPRLDCAEPFSDSCEQLNPALPKLSEWAPLLVCCDRNAPIAQAARKQCPLAKWGLTQPSLFSAVYRIENKFIIWHEIFHLWGANDCYAPERPNAGTRCGLRNCIMQYAPTDQSVGKWPFLCEANVAAIVARADDPTF